MVHVLVASLVVMDQDVRLLILDQIGVTRDVVVTAADRAVIPDRTERLTVDYVEAEWSTHLDSPQREKRALVVDRQCDLLEVGLVLLEVVTTEQQVAIQQNDEHVRLRAAPVALI
jgi:hypothetical protein